MHSWKSLRLAVSALALPGALVALGGVSGASATSATSPASPASGHTTRAQVHGVVTFAEQPGTQPTTIFPMVNGANSGNGNITYLQPLMWLPLYWFGSSTSSSLTVNKKLSLANPPKFSDGGKTVTITLKRYSWSTGAPVTARDLVFWMNLLMHDKTAVFFYVPGGWMDHVTSYSASATRTFVMKLSERYNPTYMLDNILSTLVPLPKQAWDRTAASKPVGNFDTTPSGAKQVYRYLHGQSRSLSTWATNPLWQVVDGPWHLKAGTGFQVTGQVTFVPNRRYSGPNKARYAEFQELPFTSSASEYDALRSGTLDYGYVPTTDVPAIGSITERGFTIKPWYEWGMTWVVVNYSNPRYGPIVNQLYIRQALEMAVNQPTYIKEILDGYGIPTYGPVPLSSKSKFLNKSARTNPYPYNPSEGKKLLGRHGWTIPSGGVATCTKPGTGSNECGAGIKSGTKLELPLTYSTGYPTIAEEVKALKTTLGSEGIDLTLKPAPAATVETGTYQCIGKTMAQCPASSQELTLHESPSYTYTPVYFPTGATIFGCGGVTNSGNYCNKQVDALITKAETQPTPQGLRTFFRFEKLISKQLPVLWFPTHAYQISAISSSLQGVKAQDPTGNILPSTWRTKS